MTTFWKNLQLLAQGQLFNGGYLSADAARAQVKPETKTERPRASPNDALRRPPHAQIAAYR